MAQENLREDWFKEYFIIIMQGHDLASSSYVYKRMTKKLGKIILNDHKFTLIWCKSWQFINMLTCIPTIRNAESKIEVKAFQ